MNKEIETYLEKISTGLIGVPDIDKNEILNEIKSHIYEATNKQEPVQKILQKLGDPKKLAKSYANVYSLENNKLKLSDIFSNLGFYSSVALSGIFVVPFLGITSVALALSSIVIMIANVLNSLEITNLPINLGPIPVTFASQIIVGVIISIILFLISNICWKGLKKYLASVSSKYYEIRIGKR